MSMTIGKKYQDLVKEIFPKSVDRQNVALKLLAYDHEPTQEEKKELSREAGYQDLQQINRILEVMVDRKLFSLQFGSVPLYEVQLKSEVKGTFPGVDGFKQDRTAAAETPPPAAADHDNNPVQASEDIVVIKAENPSQQQQNQQQQDALILQLPVSVPLHLRSPQQQPIYPQQPQRQNPIIADQDRITALETNVAYIVQTVNSLTGNAKNKQKLKEGDEVVIEEDEEEDKEDVDARAVNLSLQFS